MIAIIAAFLAGVAVGAGLVVAGQHYLLTSRSWWP